MVREPIIKLALLALAIAAITIGLGVGITRRYANANVNNDNASKAVTNDLSVDTTDDCLDNVVKNDTPVRRRVFALDEADEYQIMDTAPILRGRRVVRDILQNEWFGETDFGFELSISMSVSISNEFSLLGKVGKSSKAKSFKVKAKNCKKKGGKSNKKTDPCITNQGTSAWGASTDSLLSPSICNNAGNMMSTLDISATGKPSVSFNGSVKPSSAINPVIPAPIDLSTTAPSYLFSLNPISSHSKLPRPNYPSFSINDSASHLSLPLIISAPAVSASTAPDSSVNDGEKPSFSPSKGGTASGTPDFFPSEGHANAATSPPTASTTKTGSPTR